jgi:sodium-dependent dicarboxylate transporter 2/3/5
LSEPAATALGEGGAAPTRWGVLALALVVGGVAWALAPAPWPAGDGAVEVAWRGETIASGEARFDARAPLAVEGTRGAVEVRLELPDGALTRAPTNARIRVLENGAVVRPGLDEVAATLRLPDGRTEPIPLLKWDEGSGTIRAARRPPAGAALVLGLLGLVVVLWVTEAVPLFVTSLLVPVVLVVSGTAEAKAALAPFFHPIIALFFGGFLMAEAMRRVDLDHRAAVEIVSRAGRSPAWLFLAMLGVSAFLSMWMSNTAATAVLVPIAIAVTAPMAHPGYRKAMVLGIAYAATIGGVGSAIGTPANPLAMEFLSTFLGQPVSFVGWFGFGLPLVLLLLPATAAWLWWRSHVDVDPEAFREARALAVEERRRLGRLTRDQAEVLGVFALTMLLWLTQTWHGIDSGVIALIGALALALIGKLGPEDLGRISWPALLTFGGGLTLGLFLTESGASDQVATRLAGLAGLPAFVGVGAVALLTLGVTMVASNTATAAMLVPLAIPLAGVLGVSPTMLVVVVAIASSIDFALVIGTPPTMIAYSTRLFSTREIFRTGILLDVIGVLLLVTAVAGVWRLLGLV